MSTQHHFAPGDHRDRDLYARERVLNSAIIAADISRGWEEYPRFLHSAVPAPVEAASDVHPSPAPARNQYRQIAEGLLVELRRNFTFDDSGVIVLYPQLGVVLLNEFLDHGPALQESRLLLQPLGGLSRGHPS
jgi:hypothetical protein